MRRLFKKSVLFLMFAVIAPCFIFSVTYAENEFASPPAEVIQNAAEIQAYWTPERMAEAIPYPMPTLDASLGEESTELTAEPGGTPGAVAGSLPRSEWLGDPIEGEPQYGAPPGNWLLSYPGPFQRWTWFGRYLTWPTSTIGKMFFTQGGTRYVCSAAVVNAGGPQRDVIATAAHCVHGGLGGSWSYNVLFCPSYNAGGINPSRGCWPQVNLATFTAWINTGNPEYDVGCIIARNTGTSIPNHVGNVTGTLGRAWNWGWDEPEFSFGYPQAPPFPGYNIIAVAGPEWYTYNWGPAADSKYMGNDMTGGSSGGPWVLGWEHPNPNRAYPDTDGSNATDPLPDIPGGFLNGVNSHKIVVGGVVRTQEMGSPQFTNTNPDTEGLWSFCQSIANSD